MLPFLSALYSAVKLCIFLKFLEKDTSLAVKLFILLKFHKKDTYSAVKLIILLKFQEKDTYILSCQTIDFA